MGNSKWARENFKKSTNLRKTFIKDITNEIVTDENYLLNANILDQTILMLVTPKEVDNGIKTNVNPNKALGYDLITGQY